MFQMMILTSGHHLHMAGCFLFSKDPPPDIEDRGTLDGENLPFRLDQDPFLQAQVQSPTTFILKVQSNSYEHKLIPSSLDCPYLLKGMR